jgi:hypothetical protein
VRSCSITWLMQEDFVRSSVISGLNRLQMHLRHLGWIIREEFISHPLRTFSASGNLTTWWMAF